MAAPHLHDDVVYDEPYPMIPSSAFCRRFHPLAALLGFLRQAAVGAAIIAAVIATTLVGGYLLKEEPLDMGLDCPSGTRSVLARTRRPDSPGLDYDRVTACEPRGPGEKAWRYR